MTRTLVITTFALTVAAVAAASAQDPTGRRSSMGPRPFIAALDTNRDGTISNDELAAASTSLQALDVNKDGQLSADELRPAFQRSGRAGRMGPPNPRRGRPDATQARGGRRGPGPGRPGNPIVSSIDANGDRTLSAEEIAAAPEALKKLDRNNDGQLTQDDLRPVREQRR